MTNKINLIIDDLIKKGSDIENKREYLLEKSLDIIENKTLEEFLAELEDEAGASINDYSEVRNISVGIRVKDLEIIINKGNVDFENAVFDIASITKLFTLKLCYELNKLGILNYDTKVKDICDSFKFMEDYKIIDILKMHMFIETDGKLSDTKTYEELIERLKTVKIKDYNKNVYTDIGFIMLTFLLEKVYEQHFHEFLSFAELCNKYIFNKYGLKNTGFNLKNRVIVGNDYGTLPSDDKAKVLNGVSGAAGIFTNTLDLMKVGKLLRSSEYFDEHFIKQIFDYYFLDKFERKRSYAGIYLYTKDNKRSYAPTYYSSKTFAHQGYTGSSAVFDLENDICQIILVDALNNENKKGENYFKWYHKFQEQISLYSLVLYIILELKNECQIM